jgi:3-deoxy-7-phosphoheptulonate synthase
MSFSTDDTRISKIAEIIPPMELIERLPLTAATEKLVYNSRDSIRKILNTADARLLVVVGPCSIHDPSAALEYAKHVARWRERYGERLFILMRVYFEKPRTTVGWKGLINDPLLDDSYNIDRGLEVARKLLLEIGELGVPTGTEFLDMIIPQYIADSISWAAIGARTTESQVHRELASGLSCPVGFKNGTDGNIKIAVDAVQTAARPHHFLGVTKTGRSAIVATKGNEDSHIILRGGKTPNYDEDSVEEAARQLSALGLPPRLMVDCSHANSGKDFRKQIRVVESVSQQLRDGSKHICGVMIESNLLEGKQELKPGHLLAFGQSITDACVGLEETESMLELLSESSLSESL